LEPTTLSPGIKIILHTDYSLSLQPGFKQIMLWRYEHNKYKNINKMLINYNYDIGPKKEIDKKFLIPIRLKLNQQLQEEIKLHYKYKPNGPGYLEAEAHFNELKNQLSKSKIQLN
jgi:hypothetical protein